MTFYGFGLPTCLGPKCGSNPKKKKKGIFPTMTKQTISDESNLIGTRAEETHWYKNSPAKDDECEFCFLNYYTVKSI